jgi:hypothetical protein
MAERASMDGIANTFSFHIHNLEICSAINCFLMKPIVIIGWHHGVDQPLQNTGKHRIKPT